MSLRGSIQAECPGGCGAAEQEVWSFIRGDADEDLRETILAGDLNLARCPECGNVFYAETPLVYMDARAGIVAFVFPEAYRGEEVRWRTQMGEDYRRMREVFGDALEVEEEPLLFFGLEPLRELLRCDDELELEIQVARHQAEGLGYRMRPVRRAYARARSLPRMLPSKPWKTGADFDLQRTREAVRALLSANDKLEGYRRWLASLDSEGVPPSAREAA